MKAKLAAFSLLILCFTGCKKDPEFPQPEFKESYLHLVSGSTLVDSFSVVFDYWNVDDVVISDFYFQKSWPTLGYANLTAGGVPDTFGNGKIYFHAIKYDNTFPFDNDTLINSKPIVLNEWEKSTTCFTDSSGELLLLKFVDTYDDSPDTGSINLRFINLMQTLGTGTLKSTDGTVNISGINFKDASTFVNVPTGSYTYEVRDDSNGALVASFTQYLYDRGTFTFYVSSNGALKYFIN